MSTSVIIPAYNEEQNVKSTLQALRKAGWAEEIIGVNDGSSDATGKIMEKYCDVSISFIKNYGKTAAAKAGWLASKGSYIVILDADLRESAVYGEKLLQPLQADKADLVIGTVIGSGRNGFGLVKRRVQRVIQRKSGLYLRTPLSGQRAFRRQHIEHYCQLEAEGFGLETMMTLKAISEGFTIKEVEVPFVHDGKGWGIQGMLHRGKQWLEVERCLWKYGKSYS
ncbi:Glycosyltransferase involved in cell wall bisynthesis [Alteribacillus persepolensis]|uniref:Glycosyltransferase involved in cell wall bisynthesis n=1 Tax=Alteribacillus persepolensis TaxID=568899 RepID=A0A1G8D3F6_9BACI|nr:glycosyltransferase family 2 protein [Alteribacillus persepolensis]SDH51700.1 Glycosyltransferase involved in cell wall bisynthesis [Alteribacillus persepolensis]